MIHFIKRRKLNLSNKPNVLKKKIKNPNQISISPRPLLPDEPIDNAVYCAECAFLEQKIIGSKAGKCFDYPIPDSSTPMMCPYYKNDLHIISILIFLKSGISLYHKAIVKDLAKEIDPDLLTSFLSAINMFGEHLTEEQISLIEFQKMKIVFCRGKNSTGALIIKGKIQEEEKDAFSSFLQKIEETFPQYFNGKIIGQCLPEYDVDTLVVECFRDYARHKLYSISSSLIEDSCHLKCGIHSK